MTTTTSKKSSPAEPTTWVKKQRGLFDYFGLFWRGLCMGASDVVPGVSGGTMAFILGIYEELIESIRRFTDPAFFRALLTFNPKTIWREANWEFIFAVLFGLATAILLLAPPLEFALKNYPVYVWSFFFGLVLASVFAVQKRIQQWTPPLFALTLLGTIGAYLLVGLVPAATPESWWFLLLTGMLAVCAFILPGISGSFILVLLGKYEYVLAAVNGRDLITVGLVGLGAVIGLITIARFLSWLFKNYHDYTVAVLIGFMLGSLRKVWPWKEDVDYLRDQFGEFVLNREGEHIVSVQYNLLPPLTEAPVEVLLAALLMGIGLGTVLLIEWIAQKEAARAQRNA